MTIRSLAAEKWQQGVFSRVNQRMRLSCEEFEEEMGCLRSVADELQNLRKELLVEKYD